MRLKNSTTDRSERLRVARDLHDTIAQEIVALGYECDQAIALTSIGDGRTSLISMRVKISLLGLVLRDELGELREAGRTFGTALATFLPELESMHHIQIHNEIASDFRITNGAELDIYRVVREIVVNIAAHSNASEISISARQVSDGLILTITDNGIVNNSFASNERRNHHYGLVGLYERIANFHGEITYVRVADLNIYEVSVLG